MAEHATAPDDPHATGWRRVHFIVAQAVSYLLGAWVTWVVARWSWGALGASGWPMLLRLPAVAIVAAILFLLIKPSTAAVILRPATPLKNLVVFLFVVWIIATITFFLAKNIPGGPFTLEKSIPAEIKAQIDKKYRLNDPLWKQYGDYLWGVVRFDFGPSYYETGRTVSQIIGYSLPNSLRIGAVALMITLGVGIPLGVLAALRQNRWQDYSALGIVVLGVSVPSFIFATLFQYLFSYKVDLLPPSGLNEWRSFIMPSLALSTLPGAFIIRLVRSEMIEVMTKQYITAARSRGLSAFVIVWKHAMRNSLLTVVTYLGPVIAGLFTGSFVIEKIFNIPGLGYQFVSSINNRDYNVILGTTLFYAALLVGLNMAIDALYHVIDPRVRDTEGSAA